MTTRDDTHPDVADTVGEVVLRQEELSLKGVLAGRSSYRFDNRLTVVHVVPFSGAMSGNDIGFAGGRNYFH